MLASAKRWRRIHPIWIATLTPAREPAEGCLATETMVQAPVEALVDQRLGQLEQLPLERFAVGDFWGFCFSMLVVLPRRGGGIVNQLYEQIHDIRPPRRSIPALVRNSGLKGGDHQCVGETATLFDPLADG